MNCPDSHCNGESEFSRLSLDHQSEIHTCGECGREWGILVGVIENFMGLGTLVFREPEKVGEWPKTVGVGELHSDPVRVDYPKPGVTNQFTTMDAEIAREQAEQMRRFRIAIDEAEFFGEF
jgi:hypothetical protein